MEEVKQKVKDLTSKDESKALAAAFEMVNNSDTEMYEELVKTSDYLFQFVKDNVAKRIDKVVNKENYKNLFKFFDCYSSDYDYVFAEIIARYADENIKQNLKFMFENSETSGKIYIARCFEFMPEPSLASEFSKFAFDENEYLASACAAALGAIEDKNSYNTALEYLNSDDDFLKLKALNFFMSYGDNPDLSLLIETLHNSKMPENIAGKIAYLMPVTEILNENTEYGLDVLNYLLSGLGEILPLSDIFCFEIYDTLSMLAKNNFKENSSQVAVILLKAKQKFNMFVENDEYTFDEDKSTKDEIKAVSKLLNSFNADFWTLQESEVSGELSKSEKRQHSALQIIKDFNIKEAVHDIVEMIYETENQTIICDGVAALSSLGGLVYVNKEDIISQITDLNLRAITESYFL